MRHFVIFIWASIFSFFAKAQDITPPEIYLVGGKDAIACRWQPYIDSGFSVTDDYDSIHQIKIEKEGTFKNTHSSGLYALRYKATDRAGNFSFTEWCNILVMDPNTGPCGDTNPSDTLSFVQTNRNKAPDIIVYPNPTYGEITLQFHCEPPPVIVLSSITGESVTMKLLSSSPNTWRFSLAGNPHGIYMLHIRTDQASAVKSIFFR